MTNERKILISADKLGNLKVVLKGPVHFTSLVIEMFENCSLKTVKLSIYEQLEE